MANEDVATIIKKTMLVHPAKPHPITALQLSNLDRKCPELMYLVFFYAKPLKNSSSNFLTELREGLEETLSDWYPAAGRLMLDGEGKLNLDCNNFGALWVEAEAAEVRISELGELSMADKFLKKLVFRPKVSSDGLFELPLVVVQVTEFGCGGYAVGIGTNHALFDGSANFNFINAWASKVSRRRDEQYHAEIFEPIHERGRLLIDHCHSHEIAHDTNNGILAFDHLYQLIKQAVSLEDIGRKQLDEAYKISEEGDEEEVVLRTFTVSKDMIEELKSKVDGGSCTSFEVLAAHLWKARTRATQIPKERTVCLQFSIDIRPKLSPPLPRSFTGNAYVLSSISTSSESLLQDPLSSVVHEIRQAKNTVDDNYIRAYLVALEAPRYCDILPPLPELLIVSDWRHTPFHEVDFGTGEAICAVPLAAPVPEVAYFMKSSREEGGVDVRIGLMRKHLVGFCHCFLQTM
ncbi:uncharacterized protein A4U43_C03F30760 [Asparagus officinalis]|uniref:Uncharacterized protein n=1 Tax=Asparagus officinalis TaxID=4686 RepID=A0A5P1FE88_ASPOF|nr:brassinosteroid-related acyltransferase 1-like [Asparagus officinalis]ONK76666.1 uncharacterized protein A4U43_C03F30760 [Asparagus officinalis]